MDYLLLISLNSLKDISVFAIFGLDKAIDISGMLGLPPALQTVGGIVVLALVIVSLLKFSAWKKQNDWSETE